MRKFFGQLIVTGVVLASLGACQTIDTARIKNVKETESTKNNAVIRCVGRATCEFERFDKLMVVDSSNHRVQRAAIKAGIVRLNGHSLSDPNALYLSVPPGQHEVVIRFYPISTDKAESLHVIHNFRAKQQYSFKMFRDRSKQKGSLLAVSAPDPLCVDLTQEKKTIRRFCRPYNVLTGLGEFVEKKL
ncbi:MAG: hypothetical protein ACN6NV_08130 [Acinetobacter gandensis]|uniref:hypothetical protein n=1 Tax=Acinetobacter gandensis TaxID=1443941 RepID=UPI003CFEC2F8